MVEVDVVVIGGGAMGSAAAWQLARRGHSVTLLEQFEQGHHIGASHGATRNFNMAYAEPDYLDLVTEAKGLWDELADESGMQLLDLVGLVNHGDVRRLQGIRTAHAARGIESHFIPASEAASRWQGMNFRGEVLVVPGSGRVRAADALMALRQAAEAHGARFEYSTPVRDIRVPGDDRVVVVTDSAEIRARRVVVTAGAWTTKLLGNLVRLPELVVTQEQPAHFTPLDDSLVWPSFNHNPEPDDPRDAHWYSPVYGMLTPGEGIKAGWHGVGPVTDPDARSFTPEPVQLQAWRGTHGSGCPESIRRRRFPSVARTRAPPTKILCWTALGPSSSAQAFPGTASSSRRPSAGCWPTAEKPRAASPPGPLLGQAQASDCG